MNVNNLIVSKIRLYPFATGCVVIGLIAGLVWQVRSSLPDELKLIIKDVSKAYGILKDNEINGKELVKNVKSASVYEQNINGRLMVPTDLVGNKKHFYNLAEKYKITLNEPLIEIPKQVRPGKPVITLFQPIQFHLDISGLMPDVACFLKELETGMYYVRIDEVNFGSNKITANHISVSLTFDILGLKR